MGSFDYLVKARRIRQLGLARSVDAYDLNAPLAEGLAIFCVFLHFSHFLEAENEEIMFFNKKLVFQKSINEINFLLFLKLFRLPFPRWTVWRYWTINTLAS